LLSSQATVAGYKRYSRPPLAGGSCDARDGCGTLPAARVLVLGAGVAGLQHRDGATPGAIVSAFMSGRP